MKRANGIIPKHLRQFEDVLDLNGDGKVTPDEIEKAKAILEKAKKRDKLKENLRNLYKWFNFHYLYYEY